MKPERKEILEDYVRGMGSVLFDIKERKHISNEEIEETQNYYLNQHDYDGDKTHYLYSTIKELDPNALSSADVHQNVFEYENFMDENKAWRQK